MADNVAITPGSGAKAASREVTYSGETAQAQVVGLVTFAGADDAKTVADVNADNPLPVRLDQGAAGAISNGGSLQVDATQVNEQSAESLNVPNAALLGDEPLQMVGLHPSFPIPIDTATPMPIAGRDDTGAFRPLVTDRNGRLQVDADEASNVLSFAYNPNGVVTINSVVLAWKTDGFQSVVIQGFSAGNGTPTCTLEVSMDGANWVTSGILGIRVLDGVLASAIWNNAATGLILALSASARYMRLRCTAGGSTAANWSGTVLLKRQPVSIVVPATAAINISQINGAAVAATSAQLGVNAFGPTAPGAAHSTNNPVQMSGSDGTNVRRILTDTSGNTRVVGPLAAGTSLIPPTNAAFAPALMGIADLEGRVQRATGDVRGRLAATLPDATAPAEDGIIDALNNVVRELKLLNAKITDLPYWLGINSVMPDDGQTFRDDPTLFNQ